MNQSHHAPIQKRKSKANSRRSDEPLRVSLTDYVLHTDTLEQLAGRKRVPKTERGRLGMHFKAYRNSRLVVTTEEEGETYTQTLEIEADGVTVACSCGQRVAVLCDHLYRLLLTAAGSGPEEGFGEFRPQGRMEMAMAHPQHWMVNTRNRYGIRAHLQEGLGWVYRMEKAKKVLPPYLCLPGGERKEEGEPVVLCYFVMLAVREERAPFVLPCPAILAKDGRTVKRFGEFVPGLDMEKHGAVLSEEILRLRACEEILLAAEGVGGMASVNKGETAEGLERLFGLYQRYLPRFAEARVYLHNYYGKKYLKGKPNRNWMYAVQVGTGVVSLQWQLHYRRGMYQLRVWILIDGKRVKRCGLVASFFVAVREWKEVYLFQSLRDVGMAYWMEENGWVVTVFEEHFEAFEREVLGEIEAHYVVRRTGRK